MSIYFSNGGLQQPAWSPAARCGSGNPGGTNRTNNDHGHLRQKGEVQETNDYQPYHNGEGVQTNVEQEITTAMNVTWQTVIKRP